MSNVLLVPIHLDALYVPASDQPIKALPAMADYSLLPYLDDESSVKNDGTINLSTTILTSPFKQTYPRTAGVHLHWALPDALTQGVHGETGTTFPRVPNRWLVTRKRDGTVQKRWVVESDYLYPEGDSPSETVTVLYPPEPGFNQPFRYLGRNLEIPSNGGYPNTSPGDYLPALTAMGPFEVVEQGDEVKATFAAFYPNCHSVFGFYDRELTDSNPPQGTEYEVVGWYSDPNQDALKTAIKQFENDYKQANQGQSPTDEQIRNAIQDEFQWVIPEAAQPVPRQMLCYTRLTFANDATSNDPVAALETPTVAIGNTGTEALSAYLAQQIDSSNKLILEEQLEALQLADQLEQQKLDIGAKFKEARHEKGFTAFSGGSIWTIQLKSKNAQNGSIQEQLTLPDALAGQLNTLNSQQQAYQQTFDELESMQQQVFADWCKFIMLQYDPELDNLGSLQNSDFEESESFNSDGLRDFLDAQDVAPVMQKMIEVGQLSWEADGGGNVQASTEPLVIDLRAVVGAIAGDEGKSLEEATNSFRDDLDRGTISDFLQRMLENIQFSNPQLSTIASGSQWRIADGNKVVTISLENNTFNLHYPSSEEQLSAQLATAINNLQTTLTQYNQQQQTNYILKSVPAPRYWRPNEPVVLMTGNAVEPSDRYGQDGLLSCQLLTQMLNLVALDLDTLNHIDQGIQAIANSPGFRTWRQQPWHPIMLAWEVDLHPHPRNEPNQRHWVESYFLKRQLLPFYYTASNIEAANQTKDYLEQHWSDIYNWYQNNQNQDLHPSHAVGLILQAYNGDPNPHAGDISVTPDDLLKAFYDCNQILNYYTLPKDYTSDQNASDLVIQEGHDNFIQRGTTYRGFSILTPQANTQLQDKITIYLNKRLLPSYYQGQNITADQQTEDYLSKNWKAIMTWYEQQPNLSQASNSDKAKDPIYTALRAYATLQDPTFHCLSQALGGFNDALLTYQRVMQLSPFDVLAQKGDSFFSTGNVRSLTENSLVMSPLYQCEFNPIRDGGMELVRLRLVDSFGRTKEIRDTNIGEQMLGPLITTESMRPPGGDYPIFLPPRLAQPARLNFRWLAANSTHAEEMNAHPATTPICGWVLPNYLDSSLDIYNSQGLALGSVDLAAKWMPAPGFEQPVSVEAIDNPHLQKMVNYLLAQGAEFLSEFLSTISNAIENIDPEYATHQQSVAMLMGRPLALVRASLNLELKGLPAINQSTDGLGWDMDYWSDLGGDWRQLNTWGKRDIDPRSTNGFTHVKFPVRLGDYKQFNDGLVGYWLEQTDGSYADETFYALQSDAAKHNHIVTHAGRTFVIEQSVVSPPQIATMLVDPRGVVHATSGILPTKAISIPPEQYSAALKAIEITFLSAPILTSNAQLNLSVPNEPGYAWSWLAKQNNRWSEETDFQTPETKATFAGRQIVREGWLKLKQK